MTPQVSVIIPNYKHAPYLKERIDSVLNQSYQDFEVILLDDCSPDNSRDIMEEYRSNPNVTHVIFNEQNTGNTFLQWERGIKLSSGHLIWIAESDDVAHPDFLATLVAALESHPLATVAYSHSQMIDSEGHAMSFTWHPKGSSGATMVYDGQWFLRHKMLVHNHIYNASMTVFRKSAYNQVPTSYQQYRYCGDWLFWNYICRQGEVIEVCKVLNYYRQHQQKVTMNSQQDGRKWLDIAGILREFADLLHLNRWERRCLRGRWTKRFNKENGQEHPDIRQAFPDLYGGTFCDMALYEIGKWFGFLKR